MYKNENEFVRGQKIKLLVTITILLIVFINSYVKTDSIFTTGWH